MLSGAANISRGWPAIQVLNLAGNQNVKFKSPPEMAGDEVVLSALQHPPRVGETRSIAALLPDVLARYGLPVADAHQESIDVSV
jgi:hypothetical protein